MNFTAEELTVIGTLGGTLMGSFFTYLITRTTIKSAERKHFREIAINAAIENWKVRLGGAKIQGERTGKTVYLPPLDSFLIHTIKLIDLTIDRKLTAENVVGILEEVQKVTNAASQRIKEHTKEVRNNNSNLG